MVVQLRAGTLQARTHYDVSPHQGCFVLFRTEKATGSDADSIADKFQREGVRFEPAAQNVKLPKMGGVSSRSNPAYSHALET